LPPTPEPLWTIPTFITILGLVDVEGGPKGALELGHFLDRFQAAAKRPQLAANEEAGRRW
jgi:hypothetical protein